MPEFNMLLIIVTALMLGVLVTLVIMAWRFNQLMSNLNISNADRFAKLHSQLQEKISLSNDSLGVSVQKALQAGRIEQHGVMQQSVQALESKFNQLQSQVDSKLQQTIEANRRDLSNVTDRLAKLHEDTGQIVTLSKGVNELHIMLKDPKLRGSFGEWSLEKMLQEVLGKEGRIFRRQFKLDNGTMVDAAIFTQPQGNQVVCVDSKFPTAQAHLLLEGQLSEEDQKASIRQFHKDVMTQGKAIAEKYINPPQTLGFAFLYVPAESIFQLILQEVQLHEKLLRLNVIPTSPNSFFAYLQSMAFALSGMQIQENAIEIQRQVGEIARNFRKFVGNYEILGAHLDKASSKYEQTKVDITRFQNRMDQVQNIPQNRDLPNTSSGSSPPGFSQASEKPLQVP